MTDLYRILNGFFCVLESFNPLIIIIIWSAIHGKSRKVFLDLKVNTEAT